LVEADAPFAATNKNTPDKKMEESALRGIEEYFILL